MSLVGGVAFVCNIYNNIWVLFWIGSVGVVYSGCWWFHGTLLIFLTSVFAVVRLHLDYFGVRSYYYAAV